MLVDTSDSCKYVGQSGSAAKLAIKRSPGVVPEVNLRNCTQARKHASVSTLALKPRADVARSSKQGYQWPRVLQKLIKIKIVLTATYKNPHVVSVENKAKINIGVKEIHVMSVDISKSSEVNCLTATYKNLHVVSVENNAKINISVKDIHVMSVDISNSSEVNCLTATYKNLHVVSVENNAKINISVKDIHVMSVDISNSSEVNCSHSYL